MSTGSKTRNVRRPTVNAEGQRTASGTHAEVSGSPSLVFAVAAALRSALASYLLGPFQRTLWLSVPARTQCGARSRQLLSLVTPWTELPCGWLDLMNAKCVIVPWEVLNATQHAREATNLEFSREDYLAFAGWLSDLLAPMKIRVNWAPPR